MTDETASTADEFVATGISAAEALGTLGESFVRDLKVDLFFEDESAFPGSPLLLLER